MKTGLTIALAAVLLIGSLGMRTSAKSRYDAVRTDEDRFYLPPPLWLRLFCLGYNEAMADLIYIKSILHFGANIRIKKGERFVTNFVDSAIEMDPRFRSLYLTGSVLTLYQNRGKVSKRTLEMAIEILERGHEAFPDDGEIAFNLGFMHYSDMIGHVPADPNHPETKYHSVRGRRLIGQSALMQGAPPYAAKLSISLFSEESMADLRVDHLKALLVKETNPQIRATLIESLKKELGEAAKRDIATTIRLQTEWKEAMPYVPYDFYTLIRPDHSPSDIVDPLLHFDRVLGIHGDGDSHIDQSSDEKR